MVRSTAEALVLFDIDGTLIRRAGAHHREALVKAVWRVTGLETTTENINTTGMLDRDILREMMRQAGASPAVISRNLPGVVRAAQAIYVRSCPELQSKVCPGVRAVLGRLHGRQVPIGLVTGNLTRIAWKKMRQAGLERYFRFGAFAEMAHTRAGLVKLAIREARRSGWINGNCRISLVGDHPNDVEAAKLNGIQSVAVATGLCAREELAACEPDLLLPDLRALRLNMLL
jgi:phosphoglycolate phosphatase-like HAD superfamily hydrolase